MTDSPQEREPEYPEWVLEAMEQEKADDRIIKTMEMFGGSFIQHLAALYRVSDIHNKATIRNAWPDYWAQYRLMAVQAGDKIQ